MEKKIIEDLIKFFKISKAKTYVGGDHDSRMVGVEVNGQKVIGFASSALLIHQESMKASCPSSDVDLAILYHWLSYCSTELFHCPDSQELEKNLKYLNSELINRPYLCGYTESVADVIVFKVLKQFIENWSYQLKEQYINISRWFSTVQSYASPRTSSQDVKFSRSLLYSDFSELKVY